MKKMIFVLVDALKSSYLQKDTMPFLCEASQNGRYIRQIMASPGFCERSEIFTGLDCYESGNFTAIGYMPERSPYKPHRMLVSFFDVLGKISLRHARFYFNKTRIKKKIRMNNYLIPFKSLVNFALTEDGEIKMVEHRTIFDVFEESGISYTMDYFTSLSDLSKRTTDRIADFTKKHIERNTKFIPLYIGEIDMVGHKYGDNIDSIKPYLKAVDSKLYELYILAKTNGYQFAVLGDHGMVPVTEKIDLLADINKLKLKHHRQYECLFDSNMARFWFYDEISKNKIASLLRNEYGDKGTIIDKTNYKEYDVPMDIAAHDGKSIYGDLLWCANSGILISPDYFHGRKESINGMHGYLMTDMEHGTGQFIAIGDKINKSHIEKAHLKDICNELCNLMEVELPNSKEWKRIVK